MERPKIGINGFGRIGRLVTRVAIRKGFDVNAINDPAMEPDHMAYLFKYDSVHGRWPGVVTHKENKIIVDGKVIESCQEKEASKLSWNNMNVDIVVDASGLNLTMEKASVHLISGAKKVIITAPGPDIPSFVFGVNHTSYDPSMNVISCSSCTTNCACVVLKVLDDTFGVEEGVMTAIHAYTSSQWTQDSPCPKEWRAGRAAASNIIPSTTLSNKGIGKVLPHLSNKISAHAFRVPVADVSVIDFNIKLVNDTTLDELRETFKKRAQSPELKGILGYTEDEVVSSDFLTTTLTAVVDSKASVMVSKNFAKLVVWYDNEYAFSNRVVDMIRLLFEKSL